MVHLPPHASRSMKALVAAVCLAASTCASAVDLITDDEAKLPSAPRIASRGGITRGPGIKVVSPESQAQVKPPFSMNVQFQPHGGAKIDVSSVKVTYLKKPAVDLTSRVKPGLSDSGIKLDNVNVPAGTHDIKIDVSDADGRTKSEILSFTAVK